MAGFDERMRAYMNALKGTMGTDRFLNGVILVAETKNNNKGKELSKVEAYEEMLLAADKLSIPNPFTGIEDFYQLYIQLNESQDWEQLLYYSLNNARSGVFLVPKALLSVMLDHVADETKTILIAEAEKFVPNLKSTIDAHADCVFTLTATTPLYARVMERLFAGYKNVTILNSSIYKYGFIEERFDLILSTPTFAVRDLAEADDTFVCREYDMVALENLLLHTGPGGRLVIVMPARITFAGGRVNDLRRFVTQMYKVEEIAELPEGIFQGTGIKTFLIVVAEGRTEDVVIRRYEAVGRKTKRGPVESLMLKEDTFAMAEELEEIGDWNIDKLLTQQDEFLLKYQESEVRKIPLGEVADIFRGKSVSKKDANGAVGVVNITNIGQYTIDYDSLDKIDEIERKVQNYILLDGDVLLPARGTAIRTAVFQKQSYPCIASSNVIVIRPKASMLNSTYLKIFMDSPIGTSMISSLQQGMSVMNISYKDLKLLDVPFPALPEQEKIAAEYEEAYKEYTETISEAEKQWTATLNRLQKF